MRKSVTFHVGLPKTGSTTIQRYLRSQDENLRSLGFLYPGPREHEALERHNHPLMFIAMTGKMLAPSQGLDAQGCRKVVGRAFRKFRKSDLENMIWSYEAMGLSARNWDAKYLHRTLDDLDVRIAFFARYADDWIESIFKEHIWERAGAQAERVYDRPLRPLLPRSPAAKAAGDRTPESMLETGARMTDTLRLMRKIFPSADIVVRSFDANHQKGEVVSGALEAMGVPVQGAFPDADDEAGVRNPTKSELYSMLLYHLEVAQVGMDVLREVANVARRRHNKGVEFEPLKGRRFRFLSDEDIIRARGYYEEMRQEYPDLPEQPPYVSKPAERHLPKDQGVALLDWLRPSISDSVFDKACAARPAIVGGMLTKQRCASPAARSTRRSSPGP